MGKVQKGMVLKKSAKKKRVEKREKGVRKEKGTKRKKEREKGRERGKEGGNQRKEMGRWEGGWDEGVWGEHGIKRGRLFAFFDENNIEEVMNTKSHFSENLHKTLAMRLHCTCLTRTMALQKRI